MSGMPTITYKWHCMYTLSPQNTLCWGWAPSGVISSIKYSSKLIENFKNYITFQACDRAWGENFVAAPFSHEMSGRHRFVTGFTIITTFSFYEFVACSETVFNHCSSFRFEIAKKPWHTCFHCAAFFGCVVVGSMNSAAGISKWK